MHAPLQHGRGGTAGYLKEGFTHGLNHGLGAVLDLHQLQGQAQIIDGEGAIGRRNQIIPAREEPLLQLQVGQVLQQGREHFGQVRRLPGGTYCRHSNHGLDQLHRRTVRQTSQQIRIPIQSLQACANESQRATAQDLGVGHI